METKKKTNQMKKGETFPLTIKRLGINGEGVGYFKRQVVFIPGALPGEEVVAEAVNIHPKFTEAKIKRIRKKSADRVAPPCPVYEQCGGCQLQHLKYEAQLKGKKDIVRQAFDRYTKLPVDRLDLRGTIGMEDPWGYRNKSQLQVTKKKEKVLAGLYGMKSHEVIDITECPVHHPSTNQVTQKVKKILEDFNVPIYDERKRKGIVRTIITRVSFATGEIQLVLVTSQKELPRKDLILSEIKNRIPEVTSVVQNINGRKTSLIFGDETIRLQGEEVIQETLGDLSFELSARSFFQLNPVQTVRLYDEVKKAASLTGKERVVDAYCGVGTIGLWLAKESGEIRGMDTIESAIEDARENARRHGYKNAHYYVGKAEKLLPEWVKAKWYPDILLVDPPRTGLDQQLIDTIMAVKPKQMIYVSCNPSTLAKNVAQLVKHYDIDYLQPVDMFPHTSHIEVVCSLKRKK